LLYGLFSMEGNKYISKSQWGWEMNQSSSIDISISGLTNASFHVLQIS